MSFAARFRSPLTFFGKENAPPQTSLALKTIEAIRRCNEAAFHFSEIGKNPVLPLTPGTRRHFDQYIELSAQVGALVKALQKSPGSKIDKKAQSAIDALATNMARVTDALIKALFSHMGSLLKDIQKPRQPSFLGGEKSKLEVSREYVGRITDQVARLGLLELPELDQQIRVLKDTLDDEQRVLGQKTRIALFNQNAEKRLHKGNQDGMKILMDLMSQLSDLAKRPSEDRYSMAKSGCDTLRVFVVREHLAVGHLQNFVPEKQKEAYEEMLRVYANYCSFATMLLEMMSFTRHQPGSESQLMELREAVFRNPMQGKLPGRSGQLSLEVQESVLSAWDYAEQGSGPSPFSPVASPVKAPRPLGSLQEAQIPVPVLVPGPGPVTVDREELALGEVPRYTVETGVIHSPPLYPLGVSVVADDDEEESEQIQIVPRLGTVFAQQPLTATRVSKVSVPQVNPPVAKPKQRVFPTLFSSLPMMPTMPTIAVSLSGFYQELAESLEQQGHTALPLVRSLSVMTDLSSHDFLDLPELTKHDKTLASGPINRHKWKTMTDKQLNAEEAKMAALDTVLETRITAHDVTRAALESHIQTVQDYLERHEALLGPKTTLTLVKVVQKLRELKQEIPNEANLRSSLNVRHDIVIEIQKNRTRFEESRGRFESQNTSKVRALRPDQKLVTSKAPDIEPKLNRSAKLRLGTV